MHRTSSWTLLVLSAVAAPFATADDILIKTRDGATLSATLVLPTPRPEGRIPTIMEFDILANPEAHQKLAEEFAARGYAGLVADARGKRLSPDKIVPYEYEAQDTHAVLDWIVKQPWSDGKVGMIGASYTGFTAWAATKHRHPALRGIAVSAAARCAATYCRSSSSAAGWSTAAAVKGRFSAMARRSMGSCTWPVTSPGGRGS